MHGAVNRNPVCVCVCVCVCVYIPKPSRSLAVLSGCILKAFLPSGLASTLVSSLQKHAYETTLTCHKTLFLCNCVLCNRNMS